MKQTAERFILIDKSRSMGRLQKRVIIQGRRFEISEEDADSHAPAGGSRSSMGSSGVEWGGGTEEGRGREGRGGLLHGGAGRGFASPRPTPKADAGSCASEVRVKRGRCFK